MEANSELVASDVKGGVIVAHWGGGNDRKRLRYGAEIYSRTRQGEPFEVVACVRVPDSKRFMGLVLAVSRSEADQPGTGLMVGAWKRQSASLVSPEPASRLWVDRGSGGTKWWGTLRPVRITWR